MIWMNHSSFWFTLWSKTRYSSRHTGHGLPVAISFLRWKWAQNIMVSPQVWITDTTNLNQWMLKVMNSKQVMIYFIVLNWPSGQLWNRVDCQCSEKISKTHKRLKRTLFNWMKQDKTCKFLRKSSFSSFVLHKNKQLVHLACFSVFLLYIAWKRGLPWKFAHFVLFCPIKKSSL